MGLGFKLGKTELAMRENGSKIKLMVKANFIMLTVTSLKVNGRKIKQMVLGCTLMLMEPSMKAIGMMIYNMDMELKNVIFENLNLRRG